MALESIRLITFDCYGTLIDWETGLLRWLRGRFNGGSRQIPDSTLLELYGEIEAEFEGGPYLPYRQVLTRTVQAMGQQLGVEVTPQEGRQFSDSLADWEPFPDTIESLRALAGKFRLGIISNVDDDLFALTRARLQVPFEVIVTAQQVRSYKPSLKNFQEAMRRSGLNNKEMLHAGQSIYHDIVPASFLGIPNIRVNRPSIRPGIGAVKAASAQPCMQVESLAALVRILQDGTLSHQAAL